jgi:hypothetical protein
VTESWDFVSVLVGPRIYYELVVVQ